MLPLRVRQAERQYHNPWDWFDRELGRLARLSTDEDAVVGAYPVDIREDATHFHVDAEMPGFTREQISVTFENGLLTISGERKDETESDKKGETHLRERRFSRVSRSFTLPNSVDPGKVEAKLDNGVLHLKLAKREEVRPRRIEVK